MLNRENLADSEVFVHRERWLRKLEIDPEATYRVALNFNGDDYCRYREVRSTDQSVMQDDRTNEEADALITTTPGVALFLPIADCIGAVLYDPEHRVLMLSHLGRHSLEQEGGLRSVEYLAAHYGTNPAKLHVWLSAAVGKESYKIFALNNQGLKEALLAQLERAGVLQAHIADTPHDTASHPDYYSHSEFLKGNKAKSGRHAVVAML